MSESLLKVGCRVSVPAKSVKGTVEYIGTTAFAQGKWIGINLDEPKGKNNGTVKEKRYFKCEENHGMFVRQSQLIVLDENDVPVLDLTEEASTPKSKSTTKLSRAKSSPQTTTKQPEKSSSRLSLASVTSSTSREDLTGSTSSLSATQTPSISKRASSFIEKTPSSKLPKQIHSTGKPSTKVTSGSTKQIGVRRSLCRSKDDVCDDQTGFVETLKPQFTPGQVMLSPGAPGTIGLAPGSAAGINMAGGTSNVSLLQQEIENLREQLKDLSEKYETLKVKRLQDKEKLKDFDKTRIQLEQMLEFKSKIMESQASLQRDLQLAKKEARDAIEAKNLHAEEMSDLAETVEMATLDKEMAEEKAESLQLELQELRDKLEEVTLDYETLKAEIEGAGNVEGGTRDRVSFEFKQLEQQNARLRDTLVKMRDLVAHDKHEYQKLQKDLDQKKSEIAELSRTKEKLSTHVETLEEQVADLQEQVDAALGAEELVETLGNDKMTLQEKVSELEEEISDLEAIKDTNDQLLEAQKEIDIELREELDMTLNAKREAQREKEAALENLNDCHQTIQKFRELVSKLQEQLQELQSRLEAESNKPVAIPEMLDFQKVFMETKAHKRAIDLELRQIDLNQRDQHVQFLTAFMPESFMNRGGDHDAILLLLWLPRMLWKCDILLGQISDKFPRVEKIHRAAVVKEDGVIQFACRCRLSYYLYSCQMVLHQFMYGLDTCSAETLLKAGSKYPEVAIQEKIIDSYIDSVKKDQLDENILTEPLEKCLNYLDAMRGILLEDENAKIHESHSVRDLCQALSAACDSILTDCLAIQSMFAGPEGSGEVSLITQFTSANAESCLAQLKNIRRKIPAGEAKLNISRNLLSQLKTSCQSINKMVKTLHEIVKNSRQYILLQGEPVAGIPNSKLEEIFQTAVDKHLDAEVDDSGTNAAKNAISNLVKVIAEFSHIVDKTDFDLLSPSNEKPPDRPIVLRAIAVKKELDETKVLAKRLESKEMDLRELKMALKVKQEELSEMNIRKEMIEKKLATINKDHDNEIIKLKRELDDVKEALKKKEKDFEETMDHLQADIDALEMERGDLKEKLKLYSKKPLSELPIEPEPEKKVTPDVPADKATTPPGRTRVITAGDPDLLREIQELKSAVKNISRMNLKLQAEKYRQRVLDLPPISSYKATLEEDKETKQILNDLWREGQELRTHVLDNLTFNIIDYSNVKPGEKFDGAAFFTKEFNRKKEIQNRVNQFATRVNEQVVRLTPGGHIQTSLRSFPTPEMRKALLETEPISIGRLVVPAAQTEKETETSLVISLDSLRLIQDKLAEVIA